METIVATPNCSNPLIAASTLVLLEDGAFPLSVDQLGSTLRTLEMAKTPLDDEEDEDEDEDDDLEDDDDDLEDDDLDDEDDDLEDDDDDLEDDDDDEDDEVEDDDDPKPLRVKTRT